MVKERKAAEGNFAKRVTGDFTGTLIELLQEKSLESISATELCKRCNYPRSTFYNHFEDIYAVMDACWEIAMKQAELDRFQEIPNQDRTTVLFTMLYSYANRNESTLRRLLRHNRPDGAMCRSLNTYMRKSIADMMAQCFIRQNGLDEQTALQCLDYLLGTLEKENANR